MTMRQFVNDVIPTKEMANVVTKADVRRIVSGAPIEWDEQEFSVDEVTDYLWQHRADYQEED